MRENYSLQRKDSKQNAKNCVWKRPYINKNNSTKVRNKVENTLGAQTEPNNSVIATQIDFATSSNDETNETCVSRVNPKTCIQEEKVTNLEPSTMTHNTT